MSYTYEKLENNKVKVEITISKENWQKHIQDSYEKNRGKFSIQGFRKGKAPKKVIEQQYGEGVFFDDAIDSAFSEEYYEFLQAESQIQPILNPQIQIDKFDENGVVITAEIDVVPEVVLGKYEGLTIEKNKAKIKKSDVDAEIEKTRQRQARYVDVAGRECKDGDAVVIDFSGKVDGKIFEGGTAKDYRLELGSHTFIEGFEEQVCGMKIDEEKDVNVSFPESYPVAELAGKPAVFAVKLHKIEGKELPELNDEFASSVSECETLEEYQNSVKTQLEASLAIKIERETENKIIEAIVASSSIDVPKIMIEKQLDMFVQDLEMRLSYQGIKLEDYVKYSNTTVEKIREERKAQAEISVKTRLVLEEIIKKENLFVTAGEINDKVSEMAAKYKKSLDEYKKQLGDKQLSYIENEVLMNKVVAFLKSKNEII